jgi:hypothetical protein
VRRGSAGLVAALLTASMVIAATAEAPEQARQTAKANQAKSQYRLTLLHNNNGESQLIDAASGLEDFGGVARFAAKVAQEKAAAATGKRRRRGQPALRDHRRHHAASAGHFEPSKREGKKPGRNHHPEPGEQDSP